ncbi:MAG: NTP transferase domain-containing protein [Crenarchaeota archaeon]|nr:NTP transferase domain-containing protein [Thermoproteota archaeon]
MKYSFILLAGGVGKRMQNTVHKQFLLIGGKPMIIHTLEKVDKIHEIGEIIIVASLEDSKKIKKYCDMYLINEKPIKFAVNGETRQQSVFNGLKSAKFEQVILHESARPLVTKFEFEQIIKEPFENVIFGIGIPFTVCKGDEYILDILERKELINVQLPQKFNKALLLACHEKSILNGENFTEDASLIYHYTNQKIKILKGSENNIKITTPLDLVLAESIYKDLVLKGE